MRAVVQELITLGPLPSEDDATEEEVLSFERLISKLTYPARDDEACALVQSFPQGSDSCFGLAWTLLHFIESAPHWPLAGCLQDRNWWENRLQQRIANAQMHRSQDSDHNV